jgi:hypothetical protein
MDVINLLGSTMGLGFIAGIRLYATVLVIGLGIRLGLLHLTPALSHLSVLANPFILTTAAVGYLAEFFADKIPWVDSAWDSIHTVIRPLGAALLGATAIGSVDPIIKLAAFLLCGGVALSGHSTKAGARLIVNHVPEPFTNIGLSLLEDFSVPVAVWMALSHPAITLGMVIAFLAVFAWLSPRIFRTLRVELTAFIAIVRKYVAAKQRAAEAPIRSVAENGIKGLRNSIGWLALRDRELSFTTKRNFRSRQFAISTDDIENAADEKHFLLDRLLLKIHGKPVSFLIFKDESERVRTLLGSLRRRIAA